MRRLMLTWALAGAAAGSSWLVDIQAQVPPPPPPVIRDPVQIQLGEGRGTPGPMPRTVPVGTATIDGTITAADSGRALKGVRVTISGTVSAVGRGGTPPGSATAAGAPVSRGAGSPVTSSVPGGAVGQSGFTRTVITDAQGQFIVPRLPAGRFTITVNRTGYLNATYGQKRPGGRGMPLALMDGQQAKIAMALIRGGVITGTVVGDDGEPQQNAQVRLWRYMSDTGARRLQSQNGASTDDRGVYRFHGLQPGDYIVSATPNTSDL